MPRQTEESLKQAVDMMLRGFVIYEVKDAMEEKAVYVTIVTTPKRTGTTGAACPKRSQMPTTCVTALNNVIAEIRSGLVPPVGGRIITVAVHGRNGVRRVWQCRGSHQRTRCGAGANSTSPLRRWRMPGPRMALCGLIRGDKIIWEGGLPESTKDETQGFESATEGDPLAAKDPASAQKLDKARLVRHRMEMTDEYKATAMASSLPASPARPGSTTTRPSATGWRCMSPA